MDVDYVELVNEEANVLLGLRREAPKGKAKDK